MVGDLRPGWKSESIIYTNPLFIEVHNVETLNEVINISGKTDSNMKHFKTCLGVWKIKGSKSELPANKKRYE